MSTTHLWALIQEWLDAQFFRVTQAQLADKLGVRRSALSQWKLGQTRPTPEHLRELHRVTRIDYDRLLDALVRDMGYLNAEDGEGHAPPMNGAEGTSATDVSTAGAAAPGVADDAAGPSGQQDSGPSSRDIERRASRPRTKRTKDRPAPGHTDDGRSHGLGRSGGDRR